MKVCVTERSILHSISIYRHPEYTVRNCGELTVTLIRVWLYLYSEHAYPIGRSLAGIVGSNPAVGMDVCLL